LDPITLEIILNALRSVTDETYAALMKSAYSTNIKERHDHSTAIMDLRGRLVVQAVESLPIHIASMNGLMECVLEKFGDDICQGDIFVANDPHSAGGTHLPDINLATPVYLEGELQGFVCNIAHHADVGGMAPGSMAGGMSEIYQEGLRIPVIRLFRKGELQTDILDLLLLNVRVPIERRGDYFAQISACRLGERRLLEVIETYGSQTIQRAFDEIIQRTNRRMGDSIESIPDGVYQFKDLMDSDGLGAFDLPIYLKITISKRQAIFDFTGTAKQVNGNINVTMNATQAAVCYSLKALLDPEVPNNQGVLDSVEIIAPKGTLVNSVFPAPVAARANTCQRIIDVVLGALAEAFPEKTIAAANGANTTAVFSGTDPRTGQPYLYLETLGGGMGARAMKDGKDGVQVHITNTSNLPIEAIEMEYPLLVEEYSLVADSAGAGQYRGGMGLRRMIRPRAHECIFNGAGERFRHRPWGLFGGESGASGRFLLQDGQGENHRVDDKPNHVQVSPENVIVIETPGAGGFGLPKNRDRELLEKDQRTGKFSKSYLKKYYGSA
ncbi:MAG TPA: methylhydantoinase, partial [Gammaproteobacteria bacterium]|nr:methylhydantoinase [Gammaproteobacteria bacterium]